MSTAKRFADWIRALLAQEPRPSQADFSERQDVRITFSSIECVDRSPRNEEVRLGHLYCVVNSDKRKWALFKCPCGCGSVITLSLQAVHSPRWQLTESVCGRPTLYPSVWRDKGCLSHFWLKDGRILWCYDSGSHPDDWKSRRGC